MWVMTEALDCDENTLYRILTAIIRHAWDGPRCVKKQLLVWAGQHRQHSRNQAGVTKAFTNHSWWETDISDESS